MPITVDQAIKVFLSFMGFARESFLSPRWISDKVGRKIVALSKAKLKVTFMDLKINTFHSP